MTARHKLGLSLLLAAATHVASAQAQRTDPCALFKTAEIQKLLGASVSSGEQAAAGTACQWYTKDDKSYVTISVIDSSYFFDPRQVPGYQTIPGLGVHAYSRPEDRGAGELGWSAMAKTNRVTASVVMVGATAKRETTVTLLRQLVERL